MDLPSITNKVLPMWVYKSVTYVGVLDLLDPLRHRVSCVSAFFLSIICTGIFSYEIVQAPCEESFFFIHLEFLLLR
jgi:hypothetical protein